MADATTAHRGRWPTKCWPRCSRCERAHSRSCSGSALGNRTRTAGHCPAGGSAPTRTWSPRSAASSRRRSTCASCRTSSSSRCSARPDRVPGERVVATAFLGLVPSDVDPAVPADTRVASASTRCRAPRSTTSRSCLRARDRLRAKLSYTNLGFALAPPEFTISALRDLYVAALGYRVSATNLQRVLARRGLLEPTGDTAPPGPAGGRPAALFRFTDRGMRVTDPFAVLRPPNRARSARRPYRSVRTVAETLAALPAGDGAAARGSAAAAHLRAALPAAHRRPDDRHGAGQAVRGGRARAERGGRGDLDSTSCRPSAARRCCGRPSALPDGRFDIVTHGRAAVPAAGRWTRERAVPDGRGRVAARRRRR